MSLPFPADQVVQCYKDIAGVTAGEPEAADEPYWTRLKVPDGLPVFADDRPWAEAVLAHFNPVTERCFAVALAREDMIEPFLLGYPDGIGSGGPADEEFATEIKPSRQLTASRVEAKGIMVVNELAGISDLEDAEVYDEGPIPQGFEPGEYQGPDSSGPGSEATSDSATDSTEESGSPSPTTEGEAEEGLTGL